MIDVAIDARTTRRMSVGTRAYLAELLGRLPRVAPDLRVAAAGHGENFTFAEQVALPREIARLAPRLAHYPTTLAPVVRTRPYVVTIHDLIHLRFPQYFGRATALHYRFVGGPLARGAARLLMGDERTVADCVRYLGVDAARCRVVPLGYDPALLADEPRIGRERPFVLYAGNHRPHKDLATLCAAWASLDPAIPLDLLVTGPDEPQLRACFARGGSELVFTGDVDAATLRNLLRTALAYVHPALAEGFGIPMLEAAVVATPVIACGDAVPRIVAPYATTFAPRDVAALAAQLAAIVAAPDVFRRRAAEGRSTLRAYTWDRFAAATAAVYREVLER